MLGTIFYMTTAVFGMVVGWELDDRGELLYIIQVEPEAIDSMLEGIPVEYNIPPEHQGVRRFRFQIGRGKLPQPKGLLPLQQKETAVRQPAPTELPKDPGGPNNGFQGIPDHQKPKTDPQPDSVPKFDLFGPRDHSPADNSLPSPAGSALKPLPNDPLTRPIKPEQPVVYNQPTEEKAPPPEKETAPKVEETSSASLVIAWCTAAGLLAALLYLAWIHLGMRQRYHVLLDDYHAAVGQLPGEKATAAT